MSWVDPFLWIGITLTIFRGSGKLPLTKNKLINLQSGTIIKSGINCKSFTGMLAGPVDLFSRTLIISNTSASDTCASKKSSCFLFFKNFRGDIFSEIGILDSVCGPTLTKKLLRWLATTLGVVYNFAIYVELRNFG